MGGLLCFLGLSLLLTGMPFGFGPHGSADERAVRSDALMSCKDGREDSLDDASDSLVKQEKLFNSSFQDVNTIFEIGLVDRRSRIGVLGIGGWARIELDVGAIGEEPV